MAEEMIAMALASPPRPVRPAPPSSPRPSPQPSPRPSPVSSGTPESQSPRAPALSPRVPTLMTGGYGGRYVWRHRYVLNA